MKGLKLLILISMLNITMYHFDFNWGDIFNPLKAYNRSSETAGSLIGILLTNQLEKISEDNQNNLVLKNNIRGDVVVIQKNSHIMIDNQDTKFRFKSYSSDDNTILVRGGNKLEFEYDLSTVQVLTLVLRPNNQSAERMLGASAASVLGGAIGFGLGHAAGVNTNSYAGAEALLGCTIGMAAAPAVYLANGEDQLLEISLDEWSVQ